MEWKLTFSSPVATAEFSKFAGILSAALSQHHLTKECKDIYMENYRTLPLLHMLIGLQYSNSEVQLKELQMQTLSARYD